MRTINVFDLQEWNDLVKNTYKRPYNFQQQEGCRPRGFVVFDVPDIDFFEFDEIEDWEENGLEDEENIMVDFPKWLERDPKQPLKNQKYEWELEFWWERNFYPDLQSVANDLYKKEILKSGKYGINIDW